VKIRDLTSRVLFVRGASLRVRARQVNFEGVGQPSITSISGSPVFLELLKYEMEMCKKCKLNIGVSGAVCRVDVIVVL
jgi:hypothetical protein